MLPLVQHNADLYHCWIHRLSLSQFSDCSCYPLNRDNFHDCHRLVSYFLYRIVRYFTEGSKLFIRSWDNCFNIVILLLLIAAVTSDLVAPVLTRYDNGAMTGLFLFLRYAVQISRLCRLVVDSKNVL